MADKTDSDHSDIAIDALIATINRVTEETQMPAKCILIALLAVTSCVAQKINTPDDVTLDILKDMLSTPHGIESLQVN